MNSFDIDGVIYIRKDLMGVRPGPDDIIITGRSFEEQLETDEMLIGAGIDNLVFYNPLPFNEKSRQSSGQHKANVLNKLLEEGHDIQIHFEDDPIQIEEIKKLCPWINIVHLDHDLTYKENMRHV
jgi:hypothetical protein